MSMVPMTHLPRLDSGREIPTHLALARGAELAALRLEAARAADTPAITRLLDQSAPDTLPCTPADVLARLPSFVVARDPDLGVVGSVALVELGDGRAELRSLAVATELRGCGLGRLLVNHTVARARRLGLELVCVTRRPRFFARLGFRRIPLHTVPAKRQPLPRSERPRVAMEWAA